MLDRKGKDAKLITKKVLGRIFLLVSILIFLGGCIHARSPEEQKQHREDQARKNLEVIKPSASINFEEPLTLEQVIRIGLKYNLELRVADLNRAIADKETLSQKLLMLPGLDAGARYERRDKLRKSDVYNWELDQDQKDYTVSELKDSAEADLSLTWNVLDTVLAYVRTGEYKMKEQVLEWRRERQAQQLALDITEAYWQAAAVEDALDYVHTVERTLKDFKSKIDASVSRGDVDRMVATDAQLRLKELEITIRQLQANLSSSRLELSRLMGLNQNVQYTLARPPIKPIVAALPHPKELDIDKLEEFALLNRPDLFESDTQVLIQQQQAKSAVLKLFPGINFFASAHYDDNRLLLSNTWNSVGAGIGMNLLNIPSSIAFLKSRQMAVSMAEAQRLMMTVGVITQVHIALLDYAIKVDRFRLLEDTFVLSSDLLGMAREKYGAGKMKELDVTQRQLEEMAAKLRRDESVVEMLAAHKRLCVTIGVSPLDCDASLLLGGGAGSGYDLSGDVPSKKWKCTECGYIHTGPTPPEKCPVCGAGADKFVPMSSFEEGDLMKSDATGDADWKGASQSRMISSGGRLSKRERSTPGWAGDASDRFLWKVQIGAFVKPGGPTKRIAQIKDLDLRLMDNRDTLVTTKRVFGRLFNRVRVLGLTEPQARTLSNDLKRNGMEYWIIRPGTMHW